MLRGALSRQTPPATLDAPWDVTLSPQEADGWSGRPGLQLRQDGVLVYGFGRSKTPEAFKTACTRFIEVDSLTETAVEEETPSPAKQAAPARKKVDDAVVEELATAWKASKRDEQGFASLSEMGKIANNRSSFDARTYGFKRLSDLIEAVGDQFKVERRADGVYVKRQR